MPTSEFVQATSNASGVIAQTTWDIALTGTIAGDNLYCAFEVTITAPVGVIVTVDDDQGNPWNETGGAVNAWRTAATIPGGDVTVTITFTGAGAFITAIAAALLEYSNTVNVAVAAEFGQGNTSASIAAGSGTVATVNGLNVQWTPNTTYDPFGTTGPLQVQDTGPNPDHLQLLISGAAGESSPSAPAWNHTGGTTMDETLEWLDEGVIPTGAIDPLYVGYSPFVEFLSPGAPWTLRTQASNVLGISVFDQINPWIQNVTATFTKSTDTYQLDVGLTTYVGEFPLPPVATGGFFGSFVVEGGAGSIIGGSK